MLQSGCVDRCLNKNILNNDIVFTTYSTTDCLSLRELSLLLSLSIESHNDNLTPPPPPPPLSLLSRKGNLFTKTISVNLLFSIPLPIYSGIIKKKKETVDVCY